MEDQPEAEWNQFKETKESLESAESQKIKSRNFRRPGVLPPALVQHLQRRPGDQENELMDDGVYDDEDYDGAESSHNTEGNTSVTNSIVEDFNGENNADTPDSETRKVADSESKRESSLSNNSGAESSMKIEKEKDPKAKGDIKKTTPSDPSGSESRHLSMNPSLFYNSGPRTQPANPKITPGRPLPVPVPRDRSGTTLTTNQADPSFSSPPVSSPTFPTMSIASLSPPPKMEPALSPRSASPPPLENDPANLKRMTSMKVKGASVALLSSDSLLMSDFLPPDFGLLPNFPKDARSKVISEVFQTESNYVKGLDVMLSLFVKPLQKRPDLISESEIKSIFSNLDKIFEFNLDILKEMHEVLVTWNSENTNEQTFGPIFNEALPKFFIYTVYCNNFDNSIAVLSKLEKKKKEFKDFLEEACANPKCGNMKLPAFLLTPVQRIPRYMLLFKEIVEKTPADHVDREICQQVFDKFKSLADFVNESLKEYESKKKLADLKKNIMGLENLELSNRSLLKEGLVALTTPKKKYHMLLFNDLIVFATKSESKINSVILQLQLYSVWFEDLEDLDPQSVKEDVLELYTPERPYIIYTGSNHEKKLWIQALKKAIATLIGAENIEVRKSIKFDYSDGSSYNGDWIDAQRFGSGRFVWSNKTTYDGDWGADERSGQGMLVYNTGEKYEGAWADNKPHGYGTLTLLDQNVYEGVWKYGLKHGQGRIKFANGDIFEGNFESDQITGFGKLTCKNGNYYEGDWHQSKWHGQGKLNVNKNLYIGAFVYNNREGSGEMIYSDNTKYVGTWKDDKRHGKGVYYGLNEIYDGNWFNDQKDGKATYSFSHTNNYRFNNNNNNNSGNNDHDENKAENDENKIRSQSIKSNNADVYTGDFVRGFRHGAGTCVFANGATYQGQWENDLMYGKGVYTEPNGDKYEGDFVLNQREGTGVFTSLNGGYYQGKWKAGRKEGEGLLKYADGSTYEGTFFADKRHGLGSWKGIGNNQYFGEWAFDRKEGKGTMTTYSGKFVGEWKSDMRHGQGVFTTFVGTKYEGTWEWDQKSKKGIITYPNGQSEVLTWRNNILISHGIEYVAPEIPNLPRPGYTS